MKYLGGYREAKGVGNMLQRLRQRRQTNNGLFQWRCPFTFSCTSPLPSYINVKNEVEHTYLQRTCRTTPVARTRSGTRNSMSTHVYRGPTGHLGRIFMTIRVPLYYGKTVFGGMEAVLHTSTCKGNAHELLTFLVRGYGSRTGASPKLS